MEKEAISVGDFVQPCGEIGRSLRAPRGFVTGQGKLGKLEVWTIRQSDGSITAIPKSETQLLHRKE